MADTTIEFTIDNTALAPLLADLEDIAEGLKNINDEDRSAEAVHGPIPELDDSVPLIDVECAERSLIFRPTPAFLEQMDCVRAHPTVRKILSD